MHALGSRVARFSVSSCVKLKNEHAIRAPLQQIQSIEARPCSARPLREEPHGSAMLCICSASWVVEKAQRACVHILFVPLRGIDEGQTNSVHFSGSRGSHLDQVTDETNDSAFKTLPSPPRRRGDDARHLRVSVRSR